MSSRTTTISRPVALIAATALLIAYCALFIAASPVRRVGDGVEYWAMAEQMRSGRWPAAARPELARLEREAAAIGHGFESSPLRFPQLTGVDGRQDFPHFWLYPLVNVPALALMTMVGVHPNWAFTITNVALLAIAFVIVARRVSIAWAALLLAGPLLWWVDKAHGDVFTVALLSIACACWITAPGWTMVLVAVAAAQNPALAPVWGLTCAIAFVSRRWPGARRDSREARHSRDARDARDERDTGDGRDVRSLATAVVVSGAIVALPLAYYKWHLGVWSPLIGYTRPSWPSVRAMASLLFDANVGLLPNAPLVALAAAIAIEWRWRAAWILAIGACVMLLAGYAQSVNLNHGATPGLNRWTLWLLPWILLLVRQPEIADRVATPMRTRTHAIVLAALAIAHVAWGAWFFRPSLPESYRYPTMMASWLWTNAPAWYSPAPEIFAERASHREPAPLPVAWIGPGCTKVLMIDGQWPAACVPLATPVPAECLGEDRLCYVVPGARGAAAATFTPLGVARFPWTPARSWPAAASTPFVSALRERLASINTQEPAPAIVRSAAGVRWTTAWQGPSAEDPVTQDTASQDAAAQGAGRQARSNLAIYVEQASRSSDGDGDRDGGRATAILELRVDADYEGDLIDLDGRTPSAKVSVARSGERPSVMTLPFAVEHGLLVLARVR